MGDYIIDAYPLKAQFMTNQKIELALELANPTASKKKLNIKVRVFRLLRLEEERTETFELFPLEKKNVHMVLTPRNVELEGYGADIDLYEEDILLDTSSTSFDVVSDWRKATRYAFLSDFYESDRGDEEDVRSLCKMHFNLLQFYDWMFKHDVLISPEPAFVDLMGRTISQEVVKEKIDLCHKYGMKAVAYGAIYAASNEFYTRHGDWAYYDSCSNVYDFIGIFKIMNISPESPWHRHIIGQYKRAIGEMGFDGIHMDTYGFPKTAVSKVEGCDKIERLEELFPLLIDNAKGELSQINEDVGLIFNNVGNWPVDTVAEANQDAIYIEVWKPYERYHHIQEIITRAKYLGKGKQIILAAYLEPFKEMAREKVLEAENSALLLTAIIASYGANHLVLGEKDGILTQGYYVDYAILQKGFARVMRSYYDFIVRYSNILYDRGLRDVSMTHTFWDNIEYVFENTDYSTYGEPDKVWVIIRESRKRKVISFVNLKGNSEDYWNKGKREPVTQKDIMVKVLVMEEPKEIFTATPDRNLGRPERLDYRIADSAKGKIVGVRIPELKVWNILVLEFEN